ncbi:proteasome regulatory subunit, putative [Entamoeba histolytica HM-1:IMSS-B]|uniref:Proteasome regulatory subunit, putative n=6 Tax=Entamoeba histolytica TaxID=5759 RepID=C4M298_ENTH1|nr:proteasome regulatory subunit, putative [Entamoeba histolytica HM-1:IMSS]EMD44219.1 26S proteasome nonATPase regulatory subunit, putative [Entamoeba histolytica KU27]EMH75182.1 proteasome regulatory subunit, putative [Entamoeba histolytica HM-1:IMSS-B]EMS17980.1 26S proteasome non-ATPase regulatory subunit [Entamoeba histolytica HM-3:IMSS]ENY62668.1 26S proteasome non-ATPase regulatory subunit, putative [Entamoeba histolytica HM-1:IMSS-A]GAT95394.1 proteasome regulatory subunit putative [En|eukprot:XP_655243.1 proteasome regulatory subunit, putative [Entamoeba histolytica HM-1:IMSS]
MEIEHTINEVESCQSLASSDYDAAYSNLIAIEKYARNEEKTDLLLKVVEGLLSNAWKYKTVESVVDVFNFILGRRAQQKTAITKAVQICSSYIPELKNKNVKGYELLAKTICTQTEGKVFVDVLRAQIVKDFALYLEENKRLDEATQIMQSMHIETFTSLDKKERMDFLLVQFRIALECEDYLRVLLLSNKVNRTTIQSEGFEELRLEFCRLMIQYNIHENNYIENCRMMLMIYDTLKSLSSELKMEISENKFLRKQEYCLDSSLALKLSVIFLICADFIPEKKDLLVRLKSIRELENFPPYQTAVQMFLTEEVIDSNKWIPVYVQLYNSECLSHLNISSDEISNHLKLQITQHNIRMIAKYYHDITLSRFSQLLGISLEELEKQICALVNLKQIYAKINRPKGIVSFVKSKDPKEVLDIWTEDIKQLLTLVNDTCFLIETEKMVHQN